MNRSEIVRQAESVARERLRKREIASVDSLLDSARITEDLRNKARRVLNRIAGIMEIQPGQLRADDVLGDICRVGRESLVVDDNAWARSTFGLFVEGFGYDLFEAMAGLSNRARWKEQWRSVGQPKTEDEWLDEMMKMSVGQLLAFFARTID